jgi:hypothetical protein
MRVSPKTDQSRVGACGLPVVNNDSFGGRTLARRIPASGSYLREFDRFQHVSIELEDASKAAPGILIVVEKISFPDLSVEMFPVTLSLLLAPDIPSELERETYPNVGCRDQPRARQERMRHALRAREAAL